MKKQRKIQAKSSQPETNKEKSKQHINRVRMESKEGWAISKLRA